MADVFISYKREERAQVVRFAERLQDLGLSVWFDASLDAGATFHTEINREVRGAKAVLVAWSTAATESPWVLAEAQVGFDGRKLAPVFLAVCDLPPPFNGIHTLDLTGWTGAHDYPVWLELVDQIGRLTGRPGLRHLALAIAAGEPARAGTNEATAAQARAPKREAAPQPPRPAKPERPKRDPGEVAEQVAADTRSGLGSAMRLLGLFLAFALKTSMVVAGGFVTLFFMRRWILGSLATVGTLFVAGVLVYNSLPIYSHSGFREYSCVRQTDQFVGSAMDADDPVSAVTRRTEIYQTWDRSCWSWDYDAGQSVSSQPISQRFDWDEFGEWAFGGWGIMNGLVAALFIMTSWVPRRVRAGIVRGFRRRRDA